MWGGFIAGLAYVPRAVHGPKVVAGRWAVILFRGWACKRRHALCAQAVFPPFGTACDPPNGAESWCS